MLEHRAALHLTVQILELPESQNIARWEIDKWKLVRSEFSQSTAISHLNRHYFWAIVSSLRVIREGPFCRRDLWLADNSHSKIQWSSCWCSLALLQYWCICLRSYPPRSTYDFGSAVVRFWPSDWTFVVFKVSLQCFHHRAQLRVSSLL